ncbi:MAG: M12 family metallo-peptidase [Phycisphaerales bacterium]
MTRFTPFPRAVIAGGAMAAGFAATLASAELHAPLAAPAALVPFEDRVADAFGVSEAVVFDMNFEATADGITEFDVPIGNGADSARLRVMPNNIRALGYRLLAQIDDGSIVEVDPGPSRTVRGVVEGVPGSSIAGSMLDNGFSGTIVGLDGVRWWIEPVSTNMDGVDADLHVLYRNDSVIDTGHVCGLAAEVIELAAGPRAVVGMAAADDATQGSGPLTLCVAELASECDFEYFQDYGSISAVQDRVELVVNTLNLQYESEVGITHMTTGTVVRTSPNDPYTQSDSFGLLCQFINEWTLNQGDIPRDVAQMFTGREIDGGTIGRAAEIGSICENNGCTNFPCDCGTFGTSGSYCINQSDFNGNFASTTDLHAHELGHLWDAVHCSCPNHTMNPGITSSNTFNPTETRPDIEAYRETRPCLDCQEIISFDFPNGLPELLDPAGGTTVRVVVTDGLLMAMPDSGRLWVSTGGGFTSTDMIEVSPNVYDAVFPAFDCPTSVSFYVSVEVPGAGTITEPADAPGVAFAALAANDGAVVFADDFETNQGWFVTNSPDLEDGAWQRGIPAGGGERGDPPVDADGSGRCYVTDNVAGNSDVDGGSTTLTSPILDASSEGAILEYFRWFDNTFGAEPNQDPFRVEYSTNGGGTWQLLELLSPSSPEAAGGWFRVQFVLADVGIAPSDQFRVRFIAVDLDPGSVVEAGVDGVQIIAATCDGDVTPCPGDFDGSNDVGFTDLLQLLSAFGPCDGCPEDLDGSGAVTFEDLLGILSAWGPCPK